MQNILCNIVFFNLVICYSIIFQKHVSSKCWEYCDAKLFNLILLLEFVLYETIKWK